MKEVEQLIHDIGQTIYDKKGFNILAIDIRKISTLTDYFIIATGTVDRHLRAIAEELKDVLKQNGVTPIHIEGDRDAEWIVMDYGDFLIHLFVEEAREKYALEQLWKEGELVDLKLEVNGAANE